MGGAYVPACHTLHQALSPRPGAASLPVTSMAATSHLALPPTPTGKPRLVRSPENEPAPLSYIFWPYIRKTHDVAKFSGKNFFFFDYTYVATCPCSILTTTVETERWTPEFKPGRPRIVAILSRLRVLGDGESLTECFGNEGADLCHTGPAHRKSQISVSDYYH